MTYSALLPLARSVLRANDAGAFTKPGPREYPHQWNWDSAVIALGLSHFDLPRALTEIRSLVSSQWRDGLIPHVVYHTGPSDYFPDPDFWQITSSPHAPAVPTSGITQPPLLAAVVRLLHSRRPIPGFVREVYPALLRWHRWLHTARDADGSGLVCTIHPWESGTDDSPRWLRALSRRAPRVRPWTYTARIRRRAPAGCRLRAIHAPDRRLPPPPLRSGLPHRELAFSRTGRAVQLDPVSRR